MTSKILLLVLGAFVLCCFTAEAQQPKKIPRIGLVSGGSPSSSSARIEGFRQGLRELGYIEGKNVILEIPFTPGKLEHPADLVTELVRLNVDVIVIAGTDAALTAKDATRTIPVVRRRATILL